MEATLEISSSKYDMPEGCGYNQIFQHQWKTGKYGLSLLATEEIAMFATKKFGWHFIPTRDMDYYSESWFENQECIVTFESKWDLIRARFSVSP